MPFPNLTGAMPAGPHSRLTCILPPEGGPQPREMYLLSHGNESRQLSADLVASRRQMRTRQGGTGSYGDVSPQGKAVFAQDLGPLGSARQEVSQHSWSARFGYAIANEA